MPNRFTTRRRVRDEAGQPLCAAPAPRENTLKRLALRVARENAPLFCERKLAGRRPHAGPELSVAGLPCPRREAGHKASS